MARDMVKKRVADEKWMKEHTTIFSIRLQNASGIPTALARIMAEKCVTRNGYVIEALREKLIRDGYDPENYKPKKSEE